MKNDYLTIQEVQVEEKKLLKSFSIFLEKYNIDYSIYYGTLLGAIRHNDFIPWDDDLDLGILRNEYEKLIKCILDNNCIIDSDNNIEAIGYELGNASWPFIKIVNKNVEVIDQYGYDKNVWIDVFPLDNIPKHHKHYVKRILPLRRIFFTKRREKNNYPAESLREKVKGLMFKFIKYDNFMKKYINYCKKYQGEESGLAGKMVWARTNVFQKDKFVTEYRYFDGIKVRCVKDYDYFLNLLYGEDYMELPPVEKRVTHLFKAKRIK